jgi:hypothetical protein
MHWSFDFDDDDDIYDLTPNGRLFMRDLGSRMQARLSDFSLFLKPWQVNVQTDDVLRAIQSANEFISGFFDFQSAEEQKPKINATHSYLLAYPTLCKRFQHVGLFFNYNYITWVMGSPVSYIFFSLIYKEILHNSSACPEFDQFAQSSVFRQALKTFGERLNVNLNQNELGIKDKRLTNPRET